MKPLTVEFIKDNSKPHTIGKGRMFTMQIGNYCLSIVGGAMGLYGDFENDFEVAIIDKESDKFVTSFFARRGDDVLSYATIDEINDMYYNIPRSKK
jgi:hypothetical protein